MTSSSPGGGGPTTAPATVADFTKSYAEATARIDAELNRHSSAAMTMSVGGSNKLTLVQAELIADVGVDAVKIARRSGVSTVDASHVDTAAARLGVSEHVGRLSTIANNVGGVFAGAGLAGLYQILFTKGPHGNPEIAAAFIFAVIGAALMVLTWAKLGSRSSSKACYFAQLQYR